MVELTLSMHEALGSTSRTFFFNTHINKGKSQRGSHKERLGVLETVQHLHVNPVQTALVIDRFLQQRPKENRWLVCEAVSHANCAS